MLDIKRWFNLASLDIVLQSLHYNVHLGYPAKLKKQLISLGDFQIIFFLNGITESFTL